MEGRAGSLRSVIAPNPYLRDRYKVMKRNIRSTTNALVDAIDALEGVPGRKSLILYSEGFVRSPGLGHYDRGVNAARRAYVAIYFVDPRGLRSGLGGADGSPAGKNPLTDLETSGGEQRSSRPRRAGARPCRTTSPCSSRGDGRVVRVLPAQLPALG